MASPTIWDSHAAFEAWTNLRGVPRRASPAATRHPLFEDFEVRHTVERGKAEVA
jgi:heme-degrading monooxygenase HmoA